MKALHLTYRFGRDVIGGAEHYLYMLSRALVRRGVDVDIWTTRTASLPAISRFGVRWDNAIQETRETVDGIAIRRYTTFNLPRSVVLFLDRWLIARWRREEQQIPATAVTGHGSAYLGHGWHSLETHGPVQMRWTERQAGIVIRATAVSEIFFEAMCPRRMAGVFEVNGRRRGAFETAPDWTRYRFVTDDGGGVSSGTIILPRTWRAPSDPRRLGIAVRKVGYIAGGREHSLNLADDYLELVKRDRSAWISSLLARARRRPWLFELLFFLLRAPLCPRMLLHLQTKITQYDVILAQMTPFSTLNYAVTFGKRHRIPVILLPHFHMDDDFYHLRHYYAAFRDAAVVLASSDTERALFDTLGVKCEIVGGGGVDLGEFHGEDEPGRGFQRRFGVEDVPLVLFVGRKSSGKRYDLLVRAVDFLNEHLACKLIMIGPDEDGHSIASGNVLYLGRQERSIVLDAYRAADVFAMMSESESFGIVFLEAWAAKKPVIGNRACTAVADLIEDGKDGFLCRDELECAERIAELILDRGLARKMGEAGYEKVKREYTWEVIATKVANLYETVAMTARQQRRK
jgi:glycosyltransferase involved in cell wall biosynthesis